NARPGFGEGNRVRFLPEEVGPADQLALAGGSPLPPSARTALRDSLTRFWSSTAITLTCMRSPSLQTSLTDLTYPSDNSLMWHKPSLPGTISMKAPKSLIELTTPL